MTSGNRRRNRRSMQFAFSILTLSLLLSSMPNIAFADDYGNTCSTAGTLALNGSLTGNIVPIQDIDFFKVTITSPGIWSVHTTSQPPTVDTFGAIYNSGCNIITSNDNCNPNNPLDLNFCMTQQISSPGDYYVSVSATSNFGTGSYVIYSSFIFAPVITKAFGASLIQLNDSTTLTFTIQNPNSGIAPSQSVTLTGVAFTDNLPSGLVVATPNGLSGSCGGGAITAAAGSGSVSLSNATITANGSCTFHVNVTGTTAGVKNNSVQANSTNGGAGNTATASLTVGLPVRIKELSSYFSFIQTAYGHLTADNQTIQILAQSFTEQLTFDGPYQVKLQGGFASDYLTSNSFTTIKDMTISGGAVTVENLIAQ